MGRRGKEDLVFVARHTLGEGAQRHFFADSWLRRLGLAAADSDRSGWQKREPIAKNLAIGSCHETLAIGSCHEPSEIGTNS